MIETGEQRTIEYRFQREDGSTEWAQATGRDLRDDPLIDGIVVNAVDISGRKEREQALQEERTVVDTVLDTLDDIVYVLDTDRGLVRWNARATDVTGYSDEELAELDPLDLFEGGDREGVLTGMQEVLETGASSNEYHLVTKDGEEIPYEFRGRRLETPDGELQGLCGVARDVSERVARERELERFETITDAAGDGIFMLDRDGCFTEVNDYIVERTGYDRGELIGSNVSLVIPEADVEHGTALISELQSAPEQSTITHDTHVETADGGTFPIEVRLAVITDEEGSLKRTVGVARDISERRAQQRELERQNDRLEEFASVVSHDLRNPLTVAHGRLELARSECSSGHLDDVARAHERMTTLIDDLLTLAQKGATIGETAPVDLGQAARDAWTAVETRDASLETADSLTVEADWSRIEELFQNMFRNAVEHGGGEVTVTIGAVSDGFFVEDDGGGIDTDEPDELFDRGYTTSDRGTGFGLSIVRTIARAHGWEITAGESEEGGARFEITGIDGPDK